MEGQIRVREGAFWGREGQTRVQIRPWRKVEPVVAGHTTPASDPSSLTQVCLDLQQQNSWHGSE